MRIIVFAASLLAGTQLFGQVSLLDPSFKIAPGADNAVNTLLIQADQRILVGGEFTTIAGQSNAYLARLNGDGSVDRAFNPNGATDARIYCLLQQPDRKVLVGGAFSRLLGVEQRGLARLLEDGSLDTTFDAGTLLGTNGTVFSLALQADGRVVVGYAAEGDTRANGSRVLRIEPNGVLDRTFSCTNQFDGYILALLPLPDNTLLMGGNIGAVDGLDRSGLFHLQANGQLDQTFNPGLELSSVYCLVRKAAGTILVGGHLKRTGTSYDKPLLQLTPDLQWDESFQTATFAPGGLGYPHVSALLLQSDGKLLAGGCFMEVGGYWRRLLVRLTADGQVDSCFDPGLGLGGFGEQGAPVRKLGQQLDGRILVGGIFAGSDGDSGHLNLTRLLPQSKGNAIRTYVIRNNSMPDSSGIVATAATFPPGGTNVLEWSENLKDWQVLEKSSSPYIFRDWPATELPQAFFRARQER